MLEGDKFNQSGITGVVVFGTAMAIHYLSIAHTLRRKYGVIAEKKVLILRNFVNAKDANHLFDCVGDHSCRL